MNRLTFVSFVAAVLVISTACGQAPSVPASPPGSPGAVEPEAPSEPVFSTELLGPLPLGASEPAIAFAPGGELFVSAGTFERDELAGFATNLWLRRPGELADTLGSITTHGDALVLSGRDSDLALTANETLLVTTTVRQFASEDDLPLKSTLTVATIRCPNALASDRLLDGCQSRLIEGTEKDRSWIVTNGQDAWISYRDEAWRIVVERATDDGIKWEGVGVITPSADQRLEIPAGPLVLDPTNGDLFVAYTPWVDGRSEDLLVVRGGSGGKEWRKPVVAYHEPDGSVANIFATLALDVPRQTLHLVWATDDAVFASRSEDRGATWSERVIVSQAPVRTAVMPTVVAANGRVDVVYYGTDGEDARDTRNEWHVFLARSTNGGMTFHQSAVSPKPNHVGQVCLSPDDCDWRDRPLLDLFEIAVDPTSGNLVVAYADTTQARSSTGEPLPQIALATEK